MFTWKREGKEAKSKEATILNPKIRKLVRMPIESQEEIINVFLKVKGDAMPYYESILNVEYYKISKIRKILSKDSYVFDTMEVVNIITGMCYKKIARLRTLQVLKIHNFVKNGLLEIARLEKTLSRRHSAEEVKAGIERLNKYGELISIKSVMDFYNETWEQSEKRPYAQCFGVWSYNAEKSEVDKKYFEYKTPKRSK